MTEIELRFNLLTEARSTLYRSWEEKLFIEKSTAEFEKRAPKMIAPPTLRKILRVAEEMFVFVQKPIGVPLEKPVAAQA